MKDGAQGQGGARGKSPAGGTEAGRRAPGGARGGPARKPSGDGATHRPPPPIVVPDWLRTASEWSWRLLIVFAAVAVLAFVLARLWLVVVPIAAAVILATVFQPPARWLEGHGWSKGLAAAVVVVVGTLATLGVVGLLVAQFAGSVDQLADALGNARRQLVDWLVNGPLGLSRAQVEDIASRAGQQLRNNASVIAGGVLSGTLLILTAVAASLFALVLLFFFVRDGGRMLAWVLHLVPDEHETTVTRLAGRAWTVLAHYIRAVVIIAAIDATLIGIGLAGLGVPLVVPLAIVTFLGGFIPVVGAFVAGLLAVLVAFVAGGFVKALIALGLVVAVQQIDGNVLQPVVMGHEVPLHPVVILVAVTAGGLLWGIAGAAFAVPAAAVASGVAHEWRVMRGAE